MHGGKHHRLCAVCCCILSEGAMGCEQRAWAVRKGRVWLTMHVLRGAQPGCRAAAPWCCMLGSGACGSLPCSAAAACRWCCCGGPRDNLFSSCGRHVPVSAVPVRGIPCVRLASFSLANTVYTLCAVQHASCACCWWCTSAAAGGPAGGAPCQAAGCCACQLDEQPSPLRCAACLL